MGHLCLRDLKEVVQLFHFNPTLHHHPIMKFTAVLLFSLFAHLVNTAPILQEVSCKFHLVAPMPDDACLFNSLMNWMLIQS